MAGKGRNHILLVLFMGVLMGALDIAIVGPALPAIGIYFQADTRTLTWIYTVYILFFMLGTPLMAKLSDRRGRRFIYILDVFLFGVGSFITAFSPSIEIMLLGRAIQGLGAGGIFPIASAFIGDTFPPEKRGGALGIIGAVFGVAYILGPIIGGLIIEYGWQWLFIINIPIALLVIILSLFLLPKTGKKEVKYFDWKGILVLGISLASLTYAINHLNTEHLFTSILSGQVWPFLIIFAVFLFIFLKVEMRSQDPVIKPEFFKNREITLTSVISIFSGLNEAGMIFIPAFAIVALGFNNSQASLMLLPLVVAMGIGAPVVGRVLDKVGSKILMITGGLALAAGLFIFGVVGYQFSFFVLSGIFIGLGLSALLGAPVRFIMLNEFPVYERAAGQGLININTSIGQLIGGTIVGAIIASMGSSTSAYGFAYLFLSFTALLITIMAFGLKGRIAELKMMVEPK
jgi:EmrB/QacA subfamily drug resistance transporter